MHFCTMGTTTDTEKSYNHRCYIARKDYHCDRYDANKESYYESHKRLGGANPERYHALKSSLIWSGSSVRQPKLRVMPNIVQTMQKTPLEVISNAKY